MSAVEHIAGRTFHGRDGALQNRFAYGVDYVLVDAEAPQSAPRIFARNRAGLLSLHDSDHGGERGKGRGAAWVREVLLQAGAPLPQRIELLAQPRVLGHVFNPVSFWLCHGPQGLFCVIAEVNNTFGDRHSYLCHRDDWAPITAEDTLEARKIFHVSPFQPVEGDYRFRFDLRPDRINIRIAYGHAKGGLVATLTGPRRAATTGGLLRAMLRRPMGSRRVLALIHWQALKLWWKGAGYNPRPTPPAHEVSR
ncbi:DUF1365 domain-containing protein [Pararhodobacter sp. CCB-MM2]|uniref:DUF1365 domain-containing protein n=1 Tax=Pararhodobacter sp. CCB-MM2 TaxID=1786003 RepID=UPI00082BA2E7|nr:DUF1365 domain-containing protein [Pararhodobacter sp. CCB-MM2]